MKKTISIMTEVIDKLNEYSCRYGVEVVIDTKTLGVSN